MAKKRGFVSNRAIQVTINGITYPSIKDAAEKLGLKYATVQARLANGDTLEDAFYPKSKKAKEITVNGVKYRTITEACRATGVAYESAVARLRKGDSVADVFKKPKKDLTQFEVVVGGVTYKNRAQACRALGVSYHTFNNWVQKKGMTPEEALTELFGRKNKKG